VIVNLMKVILGAMVVTVEDSGCIDCNSVASFIAASAEAFATVSVVGSSLVYRASSAHRSD
jgi:hypothetical protein